MTQLFSFKTIRLLCFVSLIAVNLFGGLFFYVKLKEVGESIAAPIKEERPFLNKVINLQKLTSGLDLQLHQQINSEQPDTSSSITLIDSILPEVEKLLQDKAKQDSDLQYLQEFSTELKRLKAALMYYRINVQYDSSSSLARELYDLINESITNINHNLNSIIGIIRRQIAESDEKVLAGVNFMLKGLVMYLFILVLAPLSVLLTFNMFLSSNLNRLIDGTKELARGNYKWRMSEIHNDEFGKLARSFNEMTVKLSASKNEVVEQTKEIEQLAYYDPLTKLPNRVLFLHKLSQELSRAKRNKGKLAILYIDLDDFKIINDSFGHDVGDLLLQEVATRLRKLTRLYDTVARLSGDEFTVILPQFRSYQDTVTIGQRIHDEVSCPQQFSRNVIEDLSQSFEIKNQTLTVSSSIGVALFPDNGHTAQEILKSADTAMYEAKQKGKNRFVYCTEEMKNKLFSLVQTEQDIRNALLNDEFTLYYQPQFDLTSNAVIGLEALIRWIHPERGFISPAEFIPIAEDRGIIHEISKWVIHAIYDQYRLWREHDCKLLPVMVNLSARDFIQQGIENFILETIEKESEFRGLLGIEVTETSIMDDRENAISTLDNLRNKGVKIALDDFGSGYSSLNYLKILPIDVVKIDRSFVRDIAEDPRNAAIIEAIIIMSHSLNLKVLAEGVETNNQHSFLLDMRCDQAQGYLFSKPLPAEEICTLLKNETL